MRVPSNPSKGYPIAQKIKEILDFLRAEKITSVQGGRIQEGPNGKSIIIDFPKDTPKSTPLCPLEPILASVDGDTYVFVNDGFSGNLVPDFNGSPVGKDNLQAISTSTKLWLKIEWQPAKQFDDDIDLWWMIQGGYHIASDFLLSATTPTDTQGAVDETTGDVTNAIHHILWADIESSGGGYNITAKRCGNHYPTYCPGSLTITFESKEIYFYV